MARYAVIGTPIAQSKSPAIHRMFAEQTKQDMQYEAIEVAADNFDFFVLDFFANGGDGLNVTVPHKERAYRIANQLEPLAEQAGAVNTLFQSAEGTLCGDNTDGIGLVRDIQTNNGIAIKNKNLLVIGAGGAVRGALVCLIEEKPATITLVNRTKEKAKKMRELFSAKQNIEVASFENLQGEFDLIINGTSLSLSGEVPAITPDQVGTDCSCYDMMYGNEDTAFVSWAKNNGAANAIDGLGMLVEQAAESFFRWRGVRPDTSPVTNALRK